MSRRWLWVFVVLVVAVLLVASWPALRPMVYFRTVERAVRYTHNDGEGTVLTGVIYERWRENRFSGEREGTALEFQWFHNGAAPNFVVKVPITGTEPFASAGARWEIPYSRDGTATAPTFPAGCELPYSPDEFRDLLRVAKLRLQAKAARGKLQLPKNWKRVE